MASPMAEERSLAEEDSDSDFNHNDSKSPNSSEDNFTFGQLTRSSNPPPNDPDVISWCKRKKPKPMSCDFSRTDVQKQHPPPNLKIVVSKSSGPSFRLKKEKSPIKIPKTPIQTSPAMIQAEEFQASLGTEFPSCIKMMVRTHVTYGFWMGLPLPFCRTFLPKHDTPFILEDDRGEQWEVKYIAYKNGLSAGWKVFVDAHNLNEGDVLIFHLIETFKLRIYIIKASKSDKVNGALPLFNLEAQEEEITPEFLTPKPKKNTQPEPLPLTEVTKRPKNSSPLNHILEAMEVPEHSGTNSEETTSDVLEASTPSPYLKSFQDFRIIVNGQCLDSELPEKVKLGYYKLCAYNKQILHETLNDGLYYKLVAGMIGETVNIANEIKDCKLTTSKVEFEVWDNSLKSFEILGMKVGFLREKIRTLVRLVFESGFTVDIKRYMEAKSEKSKIEDEIKKVKGKLLELKLKAGDVEGVLGCFKEKAEKYMIEFRDEVRAPW